MMTFLVCWMAAMSCMFRTVSAETGDFGNGLKSCDKHNDCGQAQWCYFSYNSETHRPTESGYCFAELNRGVSEGASSGHESETSLKSSMLEARETNGIADDLVRALGGVCARNLSLAPSQRPAATSTVRKRDESEEKSRHMF